MVNELSLQNRPSGKEQPIHQRIVQIDKLMIDIEKHPERYTYWFKELIGPLTEKMKAS